ncbi:MAG: hypothetical protein DSY89_01085 [Deltaproteobacteria bacterium]|nr:MAG: hypothetical protein DSY89_01085 [Deltaproteobacteria bacterium]
MKESISVSLGASSDDYEFETVFSGQDFLMRCCGAGGDFDDDIGGREAWTLGGLEAGRLGGLGRIFPQQE